VPGSGGFRLGREVGLETAGDLVELCLGMRYQSRQGVHLLGSEFQEPQQKHQQKFCAKADQDFILILWSSTVMADGSACCFMADLKPRMPSPIPLPS
jgi:hypothetical protein